MRLAWIALLSTGLMVAAGPAPKAKRRAAPVARAKPAPPQTPAPRVLNESDGGAPSTAQPLTDRPIRASAVRWVTEAQVRSLMPGLTVAEVVEKLGEPFSRLVGETQRFTYVMKDGNSAKLDFDGGKLTEARILAAER